VSTSRFHRASGIAAAALVTMGILWAPAFLRPDVSGWGDWQWFHHMWEAGRVAILRWHEVPLWNPYHCGGVSLWGNPQAQVFAPTYLMFALPFGTTLGHKLYVLFHAVAGWSGMYFVSRRLFRFSMPAAFFTATAWCASGFFAWHGAGGHATFLSFYYGPWVLYAWRKAARDLRFCAAVAGLLVLIITEGGHYPFPYFVLWLGLDAIVRLTERRNAAKLLASMAISGVLTGLLGAFRIVPIMSSIRAHPHEVVDTDFLTVSEVLHMLTARTYDYRWDWHRWAWPEYGAFVGWAVIALGALGIAIALARLSGWRSPIRRRELVAMLGGLVLFLLFTQGRVNDHYPWPLVQELPGYRSIHVPSRWRVMLIFYLAALGGLGIEGLRIGLARLIPRPVPWIALGLAWVIALGACVDMYAVNLGIIDRWDGPPIGRAPVDKHYLVRGRNYLLEYAQYPSENVGTRDCYDPVPWEISPYLWLGEGPQARVEPPSAGEIVDWGRTSTTMWADVRLRAPATVIFNQNSAPGWVSTRGEVIDEHGLMAVRTSAPMRGRLATHFSPIDLPYSLSLSVVGALACVFMATRKRG
jgi:hypothetical protein